MKYSEATVLFGLIVIAVIVRLIDVTQPYIDSWSWRQSDNAMIAANFYDHGFNFFYPEISYTGNEPGYVGSEFPLLTAVASLLYVVFGVQEWIGRSLSIFFFALSVPFLYGLVKKVSTRRSALFAVVIYSLAPLSIFASRSYIADMPMLSFSMVGLYVFAEWLERGGLGLCIVGACATSLAILVKLPAAIIGLPMLYMAWQTYGLRLIAKPALWGFAALALLPPLAWYYHSYLVSLSSSFSLALFWQPGALTEPVGGEQYMRMLRGLFINSLTPLVSVLLIVGLFLPASAPFGRVFHWWLVAIVVFVILAPTGNTRHPWYQLPVVPVAAAFVGRTLDFGYDRFVHHEASKKVFIALCVIFFGVSSYLSYIYIKPNYKSWQISSWKAGNELQTIATKDALVVIANNCDPTGIYYSRRKGWHFLEQDNWCASIPGDSQQAIRNLEHLRRRGATHLVFNALTLWWLDHFVDLREHLDAHYRRVRNHDDFVIFELSTMTSAR